MRRGTCSTSWPSREASFVLLLLAGIMVAAPATVAANERLLRCVNAPVSIRPGHHPQHFSQRRLYAPVSSAMFFSHAGSVCRWKANQRRHG